MSESTNSDFSSLLNWLNIESDSDSTKYINKVENISLKWNNLHITVTTKRSFGDYILGYIFFIMRCVVIFLIPLYLIIISWLNFSDLFSGVKENLTSRMNTSFNLWENMNSLSDKTDVLEDYVWLMDDLLKK